MDKIFPEKKEEEVQWLPISDLMSVLMMVFLMISVAYMLKVKNEKDKIEEVAVAYQKIQKSLYKDLNKEFKKDLKAWNAEIDSAMLSIRFKAPEILFDNGKARIKTKFKKILNDFFPRFIKVLRNKKYINDINEVRIEGHTSSRWNNETSDENAYFYNMKLSQERTRNVLKYVLSSRVFNPEKADWIRSKITANGLSSSKLIRDKEGKEIPERSRRVEFRVKLDTEERIVKILEIK